MTKRLNNHTTILIDRFVDAVQSTDEGDAADLIKDVADTLRVSEAKACRMFAEAYIRGDVDRYVAALKGG